MNCVDSDSNGGALSSARTASEFSGARYWLSGRRELHALCQIFRPECTEAWLYVRICAEVDVVCFPIVLRAAVVLETGTHVDVSQRLLEGRHTHSNRQRGKAIMIALEEVSKAAIIARRRVGLEA